MELNQYGNKYGFHTPELTEKTLLLMNESTHLKWEDTSWHNDTCDSVSYSRNLLEDPFYILFIPNSENDDESSEEYNTYSLVDMERNCLLETKDINVVIRWINS